MYEGKREKIETGTIEEAGNDGRHLGCRTPPEVVGNSMIVNRNIFYGVIAVLGIVVAVVGYQLYKERQKTTGIEINIGERGISIEKK